MFELFARPPGPLFDLRLQFRELIVQMGPHRSLLIDQDGVNPID